MRFSLLLLLLLLLQRCAKAHKPWKDSPHGPMLERIMPPGFEAAMLPEPDSQGAQLTLRYCVQCHNLANPAMHDARRWPSGRRAHGAAHGRQGQHGQADGRDDGRRRGADAEETRALVAYLRKHAQKALDPAALPAR